jgi:hypothetical protein
MTSISRCGPRSGGLDAQHHLTGRSDAKTTSIAHLAVALDLAIGALLCGVEARTTNTLFSNLFTRLDACYPADRYTWRYGVVDTPTIHHARAVE